MCSACGHEDMVHFMMVGCCGVRFCRCAGVDGSSNCRRSAHGEECWWTNGPFIGPLRPPVSRVQADWVFTLNGLGHGTRKISYWLGIPRPNVQLVLRGAWWPNRDVEPEELVRRSGAPEDTAIGVLAESLRTPRQDDGLAELVSQMEPGTMFVETDIFGREFRGLRGFGELVSYDDGVAYRGSAGRPGRLSVRVTNVPAAVA